MVVRALLTPARCVANISHYNGHGQYMLKAHTHSMHVDVKKVVEATCIPLSTSEVPLRVVVTGSLTPLDKATIMQRYVVPRALTVDAINFMQHTAENEIYASIGISQKNLQNLPQTTEEVAKSGAIDFPPDQTDPTIEEEDKVILEDTPRC